MEKFAERFCRDNPGAFASADAAYILAFALIMLNTDAHNPQAEKKIARADFVNMSQFQVGGMCAVAVEVHCDGGGLYDVIAFLGPCNATRRSHRPPAGTPSLCRVSSVFHHVPPDFLLTCAGLCTCIACRHACMKPPCLQCKARSATLELGDGCLLALPAVQDLLSDGRTLRRVPTCPACSS